MKITLEQDKLCKICPVLSNPEHGQRIRTWIDLCIENYLEQSNRDKCARTFCASCDRIIQYIESSQTKNKQTRQKVKDSTSSLLDTDENNSRQPSGYIPGSKNQSRQIQSTLPRPLHGGYVASFGSRPIDTDDVSRPEDSDIISRQDDQGSMEKVKAVIRRRRT